MDVTGAGYAAPTWWQWMQGALRTLTDDECYAILDQMIIRSFEELPTKVWLKKVTELERKRYESFDRERFPTLKSYAQFRKRVEGSIDDLSYDLHFIRNTLVLKVLDDYLLSNRMFDERQMQMLKDRLSDLHDEKVISKSPAVQKIFLEIRKMEGRNRGWDVSDNKLFWNQVITALDSGTPLPDGFTENNIEHARRVALAAARVF